MYDIFVLHLVLLQTLKIWSITCTLNNFCIFLGGGIWGIRRLLSQQTIPLQNNQTNFPIQHFANHLLFKGSNIDSIIQSSNLQHIFYGPSLNCFIRSLLTSFFCLSFISLCNLFFHLLLQCRDLFVLKQHI